MYLHARASVEGSRSIVFVLIRCASRRGNFALQRFLKFRPWITFTMEPGRRKPDSTDDRVREVLAHLERRPALGDVVVSHSALWEHQILVQHRLPPNIAHAYVPAPPLVHFDWRPAARRQGQQGGWY